MSEQSEICLNQSGQADFIELKNHTGIDKRKWLSLPSVVCGFVTSKVH
jgi:hypothetical protein